MEFKKIHWIGIILALVIVIVSLFFMKEKIFFLLIGIGVIVGVGPFIIDQIIITSLQREKEEMFLEFARNLVESVKAGVPISQSIIHVKDKDYGSLSFHVKKLANQISLGIPLNDSLQIFSRDVNNPTISRALTLIGQAEKAGGDIGVILEAVANAVNETDKLKKERMSAISGLVVQGYLIFIIFMVIVLIMQFKIVPMVSGISNIGGGATGPSAIATPFGGGGADLDVSQSFFYLLLIQGLFTGLTIGKLSEGSIKSGIKHSFALTLMAFLMSAIAKLFM